MSRLPLTTLLLSLIALTSPVLADLEWGKWSAPTSSGVLFSSQQLEGKIVIITVWATWCPRCRRQAPILSRLQQNHERNNLQVLGFSFDKSQEKLQEFIEQERLEFPSIFARTGQGLSAAKEIQKKAGSLQAVPTLFVFDTKGELIYQNIGFTDLNTLEEVLAPLLSR